MNQENTPYADVMMLFYTIKILKEKELVRSGTLS